MTELHDTLGVDEDATQLEIKMAYKRLSLKYHPDRNPGKEDRMKEINEAYRILSDETLKFQYERTSNSQKINEKQIAIGKIIFILDMLFEKHMFNVELDYLSAAMKMLYQESHECTIKRKAMHKKKSMVEQAIKRMKGKPLIDHMIKKVRDIDETIGVIKQKQAVVDKAISMLDEYGFDFQSHVAPTYFIPFGDFE